MSKVFCHVHPKSCDPSCPVCQLVQLKEVEQRDKENQEIANRKWQNGQSRL